jgi:hypothetical protein
MLPPEVEIDAFSAAKFRWRCCFDVVAIPNSFTISTKVDLISSLKNVAVDVIEASCLVLKSLAKSHYLECLE